MACVVLFSGLTFFEDGSQYAFILMVGMLVTMFIPAAAAVTQDVVHPGLRAMSYAICVIFQNLLGASLGPIFIGTLSDSYGIKTAMTTLPAFLLLAAVLFYIGSFFYERDLGKVEKVELEIEG